MATITDPLEGIDDALDWSALTHAYGPAADVPSMLRKLRSADRAVRDDGYKQCLMTIYHQGTRYTASAPAIPYLFGLLGAPDTPQKDRLLELVSLVGAPPYPASSLASWRDDLDTYRDPAWADGERQRKQDWLAAAGDDAEERKRREHHLQWYADDDEEGLRLCNLAACESYAAALQGLPDVYRFLLQEGGSPGQAEDEAVAQARVRASAANLLLLYPDAAAASEEALFAFVAKETVPGARGTGILALGSLQKLVEMTEAERRVRRERGQKVGREGKGSKEEKEEKAKEEEKEEKRDEEKDDKEPGPTQQGLMVRRFLQDLFSQTYGEDDRRPERDSLAVFSHWCAALALLQLGSRDKEHIQEALAWLQVEQEHHDEDDPNVVPATPRPDIAFPGVDMAAFVHNKTRRGLAFACLSSVGRKDGGARTVPDAEVAEVARAMMAALAGASVQAAEETAAPLLALVFGRRLAADARFASLTPLQQAAVRSLVTVQATCWQWANWLDLLRQWNLPGERRWRALRGRQHQMGTRYTVRADENPWVEDSD